MTCRSSSNLIKKYYQHYNNNDTQIAETPKKHDGKFQQQRKFSYDWKSTPTRPYSKNRDGNLSAVCIEESSNNGDNFDVIQTFCGFRLNLFFL